MGVKRPRRVARKGVARKGVRRVGRRRLQPVAAGIVGYVGYKAYKSYQGYKAALARANKARQRANIEVSKNILNLPVGLTIGSYQAPTLREKIEGITNEPISFRQTHAYKVNGDSGRMNWFHANILGGGDLQAFLAKLRDSTSDGTANNPLMPAPINNAGISDGAQEFYKMCVKYHSVQYQLMNSSTNSLQGVIMWVRPRRDSPALFAGTTTPIKPTNVFALALNAAIPPNNTDSASNFTQATAGAGYVMTNTSLGYGRGGNVSTNNNTVDNVLETDIGVKPTSSTVKDIFNYYFEVVKSTDFDLAPGQQGDFWFKMHNQYAYERQAIEFDNIRGISHYCMIGFKGQMVGSNAITGDTTVVSTGSAQLSIIETHKTIVKPLTVRAPKIWNYAPEGAVDNGVLVQIADANQEIINDETDGVDNAYNEVV